MTGHRFYGELAGWWPLISPAEHYAGEAAHIGELIGRASVPVASVLELGSGGGHVAVHLSPGFEMTLVDLSEEMLRVSTRLNPSCEHVQGDMRSVRLGRRFDAVLVHDAVDYMLSEDDLRAMMATAAEHCRPGGIVVLVPDETVETFTPSTDHGGVDAPDGRGARYLSWSWDPDPRDTWTLTEYAVLLRDAGGRVRSLHETHRTGLFRRRVWLRLLAEAGFEAESVVEETGEDRPPRDIFLGRR